MYNVHVHVHLLYMCCFSCSVQISLCADGEVIVCSGTIPIKPLASTDSLLLSCLMDRIRIGGMTADTPTVKVTLAVQQEKVFEYVYSA